MDDKLLRDCKILVSSTQHWGPLKDLLNERLGTEFNKLVYADTVESVKEIQGNIKTLRWLLALPQNVNNTSK
jgi:hypothetical protein